MQVYSHTNYASKRVFDDPNCFSFRERFPGGFTPNFGGEAQQDIRRGFAADGFPWDVSGSLGAHETDLFITDTVNASLGPDTPTSSQGIDLVSTFTPVALRGNTSISAVFNYTDTTVTEQDHGAERFAVVWI